MKKKMLFIPLALIVAVSLVACAAPAPAPTVTAPAATSTVTAPAATSTVTAPAPAAPVEPIKINFGCYSATSPTAMTLSQTLIDSLETASGGELQITLLPGEAALPVAAHLDGTRDGVFDLNVMAEAYYFKQVPAFQMLGYPAMIKNRQDVWKLNVWGGYDDLATRIYQEIGIKFVARNAIEGDEILSNKPINTIEDISGMKFRSSGVNALALQSLGASVVMFPVSEMYTSMGSGLVDAMDFGGLTPALAMGMFEVTDYLTLPYLTPAECHVLVANPDFWNNTLPKKYRNLIKELYMYNYEIHEAENAYLAGAILKTASEDFGVEIHYWDDASVNKWIAARTAAYEHVDDPYWQEAWALCETYSKYMG